MQQSKAVDFFIGLLGTWALVFALVLPVLGPVLVLAGIVALILIAASAQRPFIVWGVVAAIVVPILGAGACLSIYGFPA